MTLVLAALFAAANLLFIPAAIFTPPSRRPFPRIPHSQITATLIKRSCTTSNTFSKTTATGPGKSTKRNRIFFQSSRDSRRPISYG